MKPAYNSFAVKEQQSGDQMETSLYNSSAVMEEQSATENFGPSRAMRRRREMPGRDAACHSCRETGKIYFWGERPSLSRGRGSHAPRHMPPRSSRTPRDPASCAASFTKCERMKTAHAAAGASADVVNPFSAPLS